MATINYLDNNTDGIFGMVSCSTLNSTNVNCSYNNASFYFICY